MIETLTPLIVHTVAQAGGPVTLAGLVERIRITLSEGSIMAHVRDLVEGGHLDIIEAGHSSLVAIALNSNTVLPKITQTFAKGFIEKRPNKHNPRGKTLKQRTDSISIAMLRAANKSKRRPRIALKRMAILSVIENEPSTTAAIAKHIGISSPAVLEHIGILIKDGLALKYAETKHDNGRCYPVWIGAELRKNRGEEYRNA